MLLSVGIKYMTAGAIFLSDRYKAMTIASLTITLGILGYVSYHMGIQPWYYVTLFMYLPYFSNAFPSINFLFAGLLLSYYPFIRHGVWDNEKVAFKDSIIYISLALSVIYYMRRKLFPRIKI